MKKRKLTPEELEHARKHAAKKWPDESVSVDDETNDEGQVVYRRTKITVKTMPKGWSPKKSLKEA